MKKNILHQLKTNPDPLDGMCYVIQCDDGSTVVIDGGMDNGTTEILLDYLKNLAGGEKPVVDMWILTHAHPDHTFVCKGMGERHADEITVKKVVFRFPSLEFKQKRDPYTVAQCETLDRCIANFKGVEIVTPSRGDRYTFGSLTIDILFTYADLPSLADEPSTNTNDTSTVFRVTAGGQTILFLGDVERVANRVMIERYGHELKSDVCQVAHHGYYSSTTEFYNYIDPEILLWPVSEARLKNFMNQIGTDRYIVEKMHVRDVYLSGRETYALELPIQVRETPYLPEVPQVPPKARVARITIPEAKTEPKIGDFSDPAWNQCEFRPLDGTGSKGPQAIPVEYKALWSKDALYVMAKFPKSAVSDPVNSGSMNSDNLRIYLTEEPVTDLFLDWYNLVNRPGYIENLKIYHEVKIVKGKKMINTNEALCDSAYDIQPDSFTLMARVRFVTPHKKGDMIGLNLEANGVGEPGGTRLFCINLVKPEDGIRHVDSPFALAFAELN